MKNLSSKLILGALVTSILMPVFAEAGQFCTRTITGIRISEVGRLEIRAKDTPSGGNNILLRICNLNEKMGTVETDACWAFHSQLLTAFATGSNVSIQFKNMTMDANGLWGGTCDTLTHQGDFSSAVITIESK